MVFAWFLFMAAVAPFMTEARKLRTWLALFTSALAANLLPYPEAYLLLDFAAAWIVLIHPAGAGQKAIGWLFVGMLLFDVGFILGGSENPALYSTAMIGLGWVQSLILFAWGAHDAYRRWAGDSRSLRDVRSHY